MFCWKLLLFVLFLNPNTLCLLLVNTPEAGKHRGWLRNLRLCWVWWTHTLLPIMHWEAWIFTWKYYVCTSLSDNAASNSLATWDLYL